MAEYRRPFLKPGEDRRPTLTWPRQIPIEGEPADVVTVVEDYSAWLAKSDVPKLFINAEPGSILVGRQREVCRAWPNQTGSHRARACTSCRKTPPTRSARRSRISCAGCDNQLADTPAFARLMPSARMRCSRSG